MQDRAYRSIDGWTGVQSRPRACTCWLRDHVMTELAAAFALLLAVLAAPRTMLPADTPRAAGFRDELASLRDPAGGRLRAQRRPVRAGSALSRARHGTVAVDHRP